MKRVKVLLGQRRMQVLVALAAVVLAASIVIGSGANFTSASANPANTFTAGTLTQTNTKSGVGTGAILTASLMKPGGVAAAGTVIIKNTGSLPGTFTLTKSNLTPTPGLGDALDVVIEETPPSPGVKHTVYTGTLSAMGSIPLGSFAASESRTYDFTVTFPDGTAAHDNPYQGASVSVEYDWTATS